MQGLIDRSAIEPRRLMGALAQARLQLNEAEAAHKAASPLADQAYAEVIETERVVWEVNQEIIRTTQLLANQARTEAAAAIEAEEDETAKAALPKPEDVYAAVLKEHKRDTDGAGYEIDRILKEALAAQNAIIGPIMNALTETRKAVADAHTELNTLTAPDGPFARSTGQPTDVRPDEETNQWQTLMAAGHA